jgi:hypothetical protein
MDKHEHSYQMDFGAAVPRVLCERAMGRSECPFRARAEAPGRAPGMICTRASRTVRARPAFSRPVLTIHWVAHARAQEGDDPKKTRDLRPEVMGELVPFSRAPEHSQERGATDTCSRPAVWRGDGHESALEALYARYRGLIFTLALRIVGDPELAREVLQDTFLRCWDGRIVRPG